MLATIVGWLAGWLLLATFMPDHQLVHVQLSFSWHYGGLFVLSLAIVAFVCRLQKANRTIWISMLFIGFMASIAFLYEPRWTPSGLLKDVSLALWQGDQTVWPSAERFILIAGLIAGMTTAALWSGSFSVTVSNWRVCLRHLLAGLLMGIGAAIASGGNDSQLLLALPALSPAGVVTVIAMVAGIYLKRLID